MGLRPSWGVGLTTHESCDGVVRNFEAFQSSGASQECLVSGLGLWTLGLKLLCPNFLDSERGNLKLFGPIY